jgi:acetyl esterase/lipase
VIAQRFVSNSISVNVPRLQVLIYPVVQFFDMMVPSYLTPSLQIFHFGKEGQVLEFYMNKSISADIMANNHTSIEQKKHYRRYVDWSFIPEKYRQVYKKPITDQMEGNPKLIKNAKGVLNPDVSPLLVEDEELAKLPPTYILTVDHDRLRDEGFIYAGRLKANGVDVVHRHFENTFHGSLTFLEGILELDIAHVMLDDIVKYLNKYL